MKNYIKTLIEDEQIISLNDAIITDPNDDLFDLQSKYGVKISRSNKSDAVYVFKSRSRRMRVGHPINAKQNHLQNFIINVSVRHEVSKKDVEAAIIQHINKL